MQSPEKTINREATEHDGTQLFISLPLFALSTASEKRLHRYENNLVKMGGGPRRSWGSDSGLFRRGSLRRFAEERDETDEDICV